MLGWQLHCHPEATVQLSPQLNIFRTAEVFPRAAGCHPAGGAWRFAPAGARASRPPPKSGRDARDGIRRKRHRGSMLRRLL